VHRASTARSVACARPGGLPGLRARRMVKEHASAGVCPWAASGADAEAGRRAGAVRERARRHGAAAFEPQKCFWPSVQN
jgi:hypothetical protein